MSRIPFPVRPRRVSRTLDGRRLTEIANHPDVRPHLLGGEGPLDLCPLIADPANVAIQAEHGGFVGVALGYGRYEVHSMFLPTERGHQETTDAMRQGLEYLFARTDCVEVVTKVPEGNRPAGILAKLAQFKDLYTSGASAADPTRTRYLALSLDGWALSACGAANLGQWFHEAMERAKDAAGVALDGHPDDPIHNQMVGATALMLHGGQIEKAVGFYNRWARWTGYETMRVMSVQPPILDLHDARIVVEVWPNAMEVLRCQ